MLDIEKIKNLAIALNSLPFTSQVFICLGGQVVISSPSAAPEEVQSIAEYYDAISASTILALIDRLERAELYRNKVCKYQRP